MFNNCIFVLIKVAFEFNYRFIVLTKAGHYKIWLRKLLCFLVIFRSFFKQFCIFDFVYFFYRFGRFFRFRNRLFSLNFEDRFFSCKGIAFRDFASFCFCRQAIRTDFSKAELLVKTRIIICYKEERFSRCSRSR